LPSESSENLIKSVILENKVNENQQILFMTIPHKDNKDEAK